MSQADGDPPEFNIRPKDSAGAGGYSRRKKKRRRSPLALLAPVLAIGFLAIAGLLVVFLQKKPEQATSAVIVEPVSDQEVAELEALLVDIRASAPPEAKGQLVFRLADAPHGASIDPLGRFKWRPTETQGPGQYPVVVAVTLDGAPETQAETRFAVTVTEVPRPPTFPPLADREAQPGQPLAVEISATDPDDPPSPLRYQLGPGAPEGAAIDPDSGRFEWTPAGSDVGKDFQIVVEAVETGEDGQSGQATLNVKVVLPPKVETPAAPVMAEEKPAPEEPAEVVQVPEEHGNETILELFEKRKLFHPAEYTTLRKIFAERFAMAHADVIHTAWGEDDEAIEAWLGEHVDIREELYTAIDPEKDDVAAALGLFHEMWKLSPDRLAQYGNLAIAVAVTWDKPSGVYDYSGHQRRTRSIMPDNLVGAIDNYKYIIQAERFMQGRGQFLPWEFLVHVVNHKTPLVEREWALQRFLPERTMIGKCYSKAPYDGEMLSTDGAVVKLEGKPYTLPNLLTYGGVCAMQADFASRVGKSLGVPATYVGGANRFGGNHAWVMWVELKNVNKSGIAFSLESHGRYRGDRYYVGHLKDPKTGERITDRQLELRLHTVGVNPLAKRQADLIMAAYPTLREHYQMEVGDQLAFFDQLLRLCPWNEAAWRTIAAVSREGLVPKSHTKMMAGIVNSLFVTFAAFPDFTWEVFDDLIAFQDMPKKRAQLYSQLVTLYERAGRPDLSCEARLRYTDYLVEEGKSKDAIRGLAASVMLFADEGRFVPKMLDRLEALCDEVEGAGPELVNFYRQFLPRIPTKRGSRPSDYCVEMYERAIQRFRKYGEEQAARQIEMQLAALQATEKPAPARNTAEGR